MIVKKIRRGREVAVNSELVIWRKKLEHYQLYKTKLVELFDKMGWDEAALNQWLKTPNPNFRDQPPKRLLNPRNIRRLYRFVKRNLAI